VKLVLSRAILADYVFHIMCIRRESDSCYFTWWCSSWELDSWSKGCWFNSRLGRYQVI